MANRVKFIKKDPASLIDYVRRESHVVWKAVEAFIRREICGKFLENLLIWCRLGLSAEQKPG